MNPSALAFGLLLAGPSPSPSTSTTAEPDPDSSAPADEDAPPEEPPGPEDGIEQESPTPEDEAPDEEPSTAESEATSPDEATTAPDAEEPDLEPEPVTIVAPPPEAEASPVPAPPEEATEPEPSGPKWSPGAQMFLRSEGRINPDFDSADNTAPDQVRVLERARLQLGATWGPVGVLVQAQDARTWGFEGSTISNEANTDLHQGWLELAGARGDSLGGSIRAGRQEIVWGTQRMIGALPWAATARSFDALRLQGNAGSWSADVFLAVLATPSTFSVPVPMRPDLPPDTVQSRGQQLAAAKLAYAALPAINVEAMAITDFADASVAAPTRDRRILDFGARVWGKPWGGLSYEAEGHGQAGQDGDAAHRAWAWAGHVAYQHAGKKVKPGGKLGYAMASGSTCTTDPASGGCGSETSNDFFNFYPTNHIHYGLVDLLGWRNMRNLEVATNLEVGWFSASLNYHYFQLHKAAGRWRNVGGALVGAGWDPANTDNDLGHEIDLVMNIKPWKPLMIQPGYGVFVPTGAGKLLGGSNTQQFAYLWLVATF